MPWKETSTMNLAGAGSLTDIRTLDNGPERPETASSFLSQEVGPWLPLSGIGALQPASRVPPRVP